MRRFHTSHQSKTPRGERLRSWSFVIVAVLSCVLIPGVRASAYSNDDFESMYNNTPFYDPSTLACSTTSAASFTLPSAVPASYKEVLQAAAKASNTSVSLLAAIYLDENGNTWKPFPSDPKQDGSSWPTSTTGAEGPFQFEPGTWSSYATDGNGDGKKDVQNMWDAAFSAAALLAASGAISTAALANANIPTINGTIDNNTAVLTPHTLLWAAAAYNAGEGAVEMAKGRVANLPGQTQYYVDNTFTVINSGFTKGGFPNAQQIVDETGGAGPAPGTPSNTPASACGGNNTSIVSTALNLSWPEQFQIAQDNKKLCSQNPAAGCESRTSPLSPKDTYTAALGQVFPDALHSPILNYGADCGLFVATVMHYSKADTSYPESYTPTQAGYVKQHTDKYAPVASITNTSQLSPGDVLVLAGPGGAGHTFIYIGPQAAYSGYNEASASEGDRMPNLGMISWDVNAGLGDLLGRGTYIVGRLLNK